MRAQLASQSGEAAGGQGYSCSHCKSDLHGGGRAACPWKDKSSSDSKKAAAAFMVRVASGNVEAPAPT